MEQPPIHFSFRSFERNYMMDFIAIRKKNKKLDLYGYYKLLSDQYMNIFSETHQFLTDDDSLFQGLEKYIENEKFAEYIWYEFDSYGNFLEENNLPINSQGLREYLKFNISYIGFKTVLEIEDINRSLLNEMAKLKFSAKESKNNTEHKQEEPYKIHSKITNIQAIGFLFTEMIEKGLIQPKRKNGKISPLNTARMILEHFYFEDLENQPSKEYIAKTLFENNKFSEDKTGLFHFPTLKQINEKL